MLPKAELARTGRMVYGHPDMTPEKAREFRRVLFARAIECPVDSQGRVLLPAPAIDKLGLGTEVVLVGAGERIEVWKPARWEEAERAQRERFNLIAKEIGF
jgi:MraZ protein